MPISKDLLIDPSKDGAIVETTNLTIKEEIDSLLDILDEKILALKVPNYVKHELSRPVYKLWREIEREVDIHTPKSEA